MICSLYMVFDKKESLPQGLLTEVFLANPLGMNQIISINVTLYVCLTYISVQRVSLQVYCFT